MSLMIGEALRAVGKSKIKLIETHVSMGHQRENNERPLAH